MPNYWPFSGNWLENTASCNLLLLSAFILFCIFIWEDFFYFLQILWRHRHSSCYVTSPCDHPIVHKHTTTVMSTFRRTALPSRRVYLPAVAIKRPLLSLLWRPRKTTYAILSMKKIYACLSMVSVCWGPLKYSCIFASNATCLAAAHFYGAIFLRWARDRLEIDVHVLK